MKQLIVTVAMIIVALNLFFHLYYGLADTVDSGASEYHIEQTGTFVTNKLVPFSGVSEDEDGNLVVPSH